MRRQRPPLLALLALHPLDLARRLRLRRLRRGDRRRLRRGLRVMRLFYTAGFTLYMVTIIEIYSVKPDLEGDLGELEHRREQPEHLRPQGKIHRVDPKFAS